LVFFFIVDPKASKFFKDVVFDDSYTIIGLGQGFGKSVDSLERFWFILENRADIKKLKRDWVFTRPIRHVQYEKMNFDVFVVKDKRVVTHRGVIYPQQGAVTVASGWFFFDTTKLIHLHEEHPLHYIKKIIRFDTYIQYAAYGNSVLHDPTLLFFYEPSLGFEGSFEILTHRTPEPVSMVNAQEAINKEMEVLDPSTHFQVILPLTDSFNRANTDRVKLIVECSKAVYTKYEHEGREKGPWQPTPIEIISYWRDDK